MSYVPAKYGVEYIFYVGLESVATAGTFQSSATIASGDVKISKDGGALANLTTLPAVTPGSSKMVKVTVSATEMEAQNVTIVFSDASGGEWKDLIVSIQTAARQIDDLAYPTTSGRSIDVTATGAVGVDWANVENPTTTVGLSGTTVKTATDVETDTADIQSRLPAALVSGRIDSSVGAMAAGAITAAAIATDAIDADALAADAVTEIQNGLATGSIPSAATIADAVWDEATSGHTTSGTFGEQLKTDVDAILVDTGTDGVVLSTAQMQALADIVLGRSVSNAEGAAGLHSITELILAILESSTATGSWVIKKTDGSTTFNTRTLTTDANAVPITGVS